MIVAPAHNNELPHLYGFNQKSEEELFSNHKIVAATATALCLSVDTLRDTVEDLKDSVKDFEEGRIEDPSTEAPRLMAALAALLEEGAVSNAIQALKFLASLFGQITLSKLDIFSPLWNDLLVRRLFKIL